MKNLSNPEAKQRREVRIVLYIPFMIPRNEFSVHFWLFTTEIKEKGRKKKKRKKKKKKKKKAYVKKA